MVGRLVRGTIIVLGILAFIAVGLVILFSDPDIRDAELAAKYATPPSKFLVLPSGARIHYRDQGSRSGPALVMLHGSNASLHAWEPWVAQIGDGFRMVSLDLPGHGLTGSVPGDDYSQEGMAQVVEQFTTALGIQRFAIAGNSMGGGVAARFTLHHPERVTALILVDAAGMPTATKRDPGLGFTIARLPLIQNVMLWVSPRSLFEEGLRKAFFNDALVTQDMVERYWELNRKVGNRAATLKRFQTPQDSFLVDNANRITAPTLILWGDQDTLTPRDMGDAWNAAIRGSKLIVFRNVGHVPMEEVPEQSARAVREFLAPSPAPAG